MSFCNQFKCVYPVARKSRKPQCCGNIAGWRNIRSVLLLQETLPLREQEAVVYLSTVSWDIHTASSLSVGQKKGIISP